MYLNIAAILKRKGITSKELSIMIGISTTAMSSIVTGKSQPRFELLDKIALCLDVDMRELFISSKHNDLQPLYIQKDDGSFVQIGMIKK